MNTSKIPERQANIVYSALEKLKELPGVKQLTALFGPAIVALIPQAAVQSHPPAPIHAEKTAEGGHGKHKPSPDVEKQLRSSVTVVERMNKNGVQRTLDEEHKKKPLFRRPKATDPLTKVCIDGRTLNVGLTLSRASAGGILMTKEEYEVSIRSDLEIIGNKTKERRKAGEPDPEVEVIIRPHIAEGQPGLQCGAGEAALKAGGKKNPTLNEVDKAVVKNAEDYGKDLAARARDAGYRVNVRVVPIGPKNMVNTEGHPEPIAILNAIEDEYTNNDGRGDGIKFFATNTVLGEDIAIYEMYVSAKIAKGKHGMDHEAIKVPEGTPHRQVIRCYPEDEKRLRRKLEARIRADKELSALVDRGEIVFEVWSVERKKN